MHWAVTILPMSASPSSLPGSNGTALSCSPSDSLSVYEQMHIHSFFTLFGEICIYDCGHFPIQPLKLQMPKTTLYQATLACGGCSVWWPTSPVRLGLRDFTAKTVAVPGKLRHSATKPQGHTLQGTKPHYFHDLGQVLSGPCDWVDWRKFKESS